MKTVTLTLLLEYVFILLLFAGNLFEASPEFWNAMTASLYEPGSTVSFPYLTRPFAKTGFIPDLPCLRRNVVNPIFDTSCFDLACILEKELHALIKLKVSQLLRSILQFILSQAEPSTPDILQNIILTSDDHDHVSESSQKLTVEDRAQIVDWCYSLIDLCQPDRMWQWP